MRLYDEWVTTSTRRQVKTGRAATKDDPGSDSEYEDVESSRWVEREEVRNRLSSIAPCIYLDDGSGHRALIQPSDRQAWARDNAVLVTQETQQAALGGLGLQA